MKTQPLVVVLAAGCGRHFVPLTSNKTLFPFLGKPLLAHTLHMIQKAGLQNVLVITSTSNHEQVKNCSPEGLIVDTYLLDKPLGMGYALVKAKKALGDSPILVLNAVDVLEPALIADTIRLANGQYGTLAGLSVEEYFPAGYLAFLNGKISAVVEKPGADKRPSKYVKLVCDYLSEPEEFIETLETIDWKKDDSYEKALSLLLKKHPFGFVPHTGGWKKLKYSFHVLDVMHLLLSYIKEPYVSPAAFVSEKAVIQGTCVIEAGAKIFEGAVVKDSYIGKNAVVGNNALVRQSCVEEGATVGFGSEVARSYVGQSCQIHHAFVGDSVLEGTCNVSWGTCLTNLRIDGKTIKLKLEKESIETNREKLGTIAAHGVFFGANTTTLPGVTIGEGARTYPGSIVHSPLAEHAILKTHQKQELKLTK